MSHPTTTRKGWRVFVVLLSVTFAQLSLCARSLAADQVHEFTLDLSNSTDKPKTVAVAGSFNGWSKDANPLKSDGQGRWSGKVALAEGTYQYKFVLDGDRWIKDPLGDASLEADDNYGGKNSAVLMGPDARKLPPPEPNHVNSDGVFFNPESVGDFSLMSPDSARLRVRTLANDVEQVNAVFRESAEGEVKQPLTRVGMEGKLEVWGGIVSAPKGANLVDISLQIKDGNTVYSMSKGGQLAYGRDKQLEHPVNPPEWAKTAIWYQIFPDRFRNGDPSNDPGDKWYERLIPWTHNWWKAAPSEVPGDENFYKGAGNVWKRRFGGDIQGIQQSLPYLRSIGVNAIYLNPIFEAESMHKYDTADYRHIDDNFGVKNDNSVAIAPRPVPDDEKQYLSPEKVQQSETPAVTSFELFEVDGTPVAKDHVETDDPATWKFTKSDLVFLKFLDEAHQQGFKVILDGVFNHVGLAHPFFQDVLEKGKNSKYIDWFEITDFGDEKNWKKLTDPYAVHGKPGGIQWKAWDKENGHLPVFKKDAKMGLAKGPYDHIMAISKRWLAPGGDPSKGIDGWRLDVPGDIPHPFWIEWNKLVKGTKKDAYITGEIWTWAQAWLNKGDQFDAVMNYRFATAAQDFFVNKEKAITPTQLASRLNEMIYNYPLQVAMVQQNLFDSHDTDRFASMFMNPDLVYDAANRIQDNGPNYSPAKPGTIERAKQKLAVTLQMTFVGAPMTYYGNENGMWGVDDPSDRQPMTWKDLLPFEDPEIEFNEDLFKHYQRLGALRLQTPALCLGFFHTILTDDANGVIAFAREFQGKTVYVVLNRSGSEQTVELPVKGETFINWSDEKMTELKQIIGGAPDARPTISVANNAAPLTSVNGKVKLTVKPYGDAVLSLK